jgi:hypothetical protein
MNEDQKMTCFSIIKHYLITTYLSSVNTLVATSTDITHGDKGTRKRNKEI